MENSRIQQLFLLYYNRQATEQEELELAEKFAEGNIDANLSLVLKQLWKEVGPHPEATQKDSIAMAKAIVERAGSENSGTDSIPERVHFLRTAWFRYAAAIFILAFAGVVTYFITTEKNRTNTDRTLTHAPASKPILPGSNKAMLTLADGSTIMLDSASNGPLTNQGGTRIIKLDGGSLAYRPARRTNDQPLYNTISTPRGGQYQLVLPDGSKVWLNAASSVRFAAAFDKERTVSITGEVFFEITPDKLQPFKVIVNEKTSIEVLGTSFNINAYADEGSINTTLISGSVRVQTGAQTQLLKPDQQAQVMPATGIKLIRNADTEQAVAWKNGMFNAEGASLKALMRQVSRWYDVEIVYEKGVPDLQFFGELSRSLTLDDLISVLKDNDLRVRLEGRRLIITA